MDIDYNEYCEALKHSDRGKTVVLKRQLNEVFVNNYNPSFLLAWQANMDIQFAVDHYAIVTYIADYFTKDDSGLTQVLQKAVKDTKYTNDFDRLNYLKQVFFTHRQVNVCEATYRLIPGLNLKGSNVTCIFISSGFPGNRTVKLNRVCEDDEVDVDQLDDEEIDEENFYHNVTDHNVVTMTGREGKYSVTQSIHEKYEKRPDRA